MFDRDKIIGFDFDGWPVCKMTVREILMDLGLTLNPKTNKLEISNNNKVLDLYPNRYIDDGMAYGVDEQKITEVHVHYDEDSDEPQYVNIFTETELPNINIWLEDKVQPCEQVTYNGKEYFVKQLRDYGTNETVNDSNHDPDDDPNQERYKYELCPDLFNNNIVDNIFVTREELRKALENGKQES